jgi:CheY-like chemotaxis protein
MKKLNSILLIDDDKATNFISKMLIKKTAITDHIETVLNGKQALEYLTNTGKYSNPSATTPQPMLILLDINMPVMDGWEFVEAYQNLKKDYTTEIIMLTSSVNPDDRERAKKYPAISGFQNKILKLEDLLLIVNTYFPDHID